MDRETIEKAALEHALNTTGLDYIGEVECENGFIAGAEWRINAVWHTDLKEAQTQRQFLVEFTNGRVGMFDDIRCLKGIEDLVARYAYVDELLPNTEK